MCSQNYFSNFSTLKINEAFIKRNHVKWRNKLMKYEFEVRAEVNTNKYTLIKFDR